MLSGEFERKLRKLNRRLHIYCGNDDSKPAGLFYVTPYGEPVEICGVDKNWMGEHMERRWNGKIIRAGWRRTMRILIERKMVDRRAAERAFGTHFAYAPLSRTKIEQDPLSRMIAAAMERGQRLAEKKFRPEVVDALRREGEDYMDWRDLVEIHRERERLRAKGERV